MLAYYYALSGLNNVTPLIPGRCPGLYYYALSGQKHTLSFCFAYFIVFALKERNYHSPGQRPGFTVIQKLSSPERAQ